MSLTNDETVVFGFKAVTVNCTFSIPPFTQPFFPWRDLFWHHDRNQMYDVSGVFFGNVNPAPTFLVKWDSGSELKQNRRLCLIWCAYYKLWKLFKRDSLVTFINGTHRVKENTNFFAGSALSWTELHISAQIQSLCSHTATAKPKTNILRTLCNTIRGHFNGLVAISIVCFWIPGILQTAFVSATYNQEVFWSGNWPIVRQD